MYIKGIISASPDISGHGWCSNKVNTLSLQAKSCCCLILQTVFCEPCPNWINFRQRKSDLEMFKRSHMQESSKCVILSDLLLLKFCIFSAVLVSTAGMRPFLQLSRSGDYLSSYGSWLLLVASFAAEHRVPGPVGLVVAVPGLQSTGKLSGYGTAQLLRSMWFFPESLFVDGFFTTKPQEVPTLLFYI